MSTTKKQYRQGDLLITELSKDEFAELVNQNPKKNIIKNGVILEGEATGHAHRLDNLEAGEIWHPTASPRDDGMYLKIVKEDTKIVHEEHGDIPLEKGKMYAFTRQKTFSERGARYVYD